jgi:carbohydrate-selective porin OprB
MNSFFDSLNINTNNFKRPKNGLLCIALLLTTRLLGAQELNLQVLNDSSYVAKGGLNEHTFDNRIFGLLGLSYQLSSNTAVYGDLQFNRGKNGSEAVGDLQAYSNIDADNFSAIGELWIQHELPTLGLRFKLGQVDANNEFAYVDHAVEFINSSMGFSPTVTYLPTFPEPRLSLNAFWHSDTIGGFGFGAYTNEDRSFESPFVISQWKKQWSDLEVSLGYWSQKDASKFNVANDNTAQSLAEEGTATGLYATLSGNIEQSIFASNTTGWFIQLGSSDQSYSEITKHIGAGLTLYGLGKANNDLAGIGLTYIETNPRLSFEYAGSETALEVFYKRQLSDKISLKPDLQIVLNPASEPNIEDAIVFTLRAEFAFE